MFICLSAFHKSHEKICLKFQVGSEEVLLRHQKSLVCLKPQVGPEELYSHQKALMCLKLQVGLEEL